MRSMTLPAVAFTLCGMTAAMPAAGPDERGSQQQPAQPTTQLPRGAMPVLGRPTTREDQLPLLNFDEYFLGTWKFTWDLPESPLGSGGHIEGTEIYRAATADTTIAGGRFYESELDATGPDGPIKVRSTIIYHKDHKVLVRYEQDSRGFALLKSGTIGGDNGGYYTIYYESAPFTYKGQTLRMRTTTRLLSPVSYKVESRISIDGGPFQNMGHPWWQKQVPGVTQAR